SPERPRPSTGSSSSCPGSSSWPPSSWTPSSCNSGRRFQHRCRREFYANYKQPGKTRDRLPPAEGAQRRHAVWTPCANLEITCLDYLFYITELLHSEPKGRNPCHFSRP